MSECSLIIYIQDLRVSIKKIKLLPLCVFFLIAWRPGAVSPATYGPDITDEQTVRIRILSKPMRLCQEGDAAAMPIFLFPEDTRFDDASGAGSVSIRRAEARPAVGGWTLVTDAGDLSGTFGGMMDTPGPDHTFELRTGNERRRYPLPLEIRNHKGGMEFIITERLPRYARDCARVEYGPMPPGTEEAFEALTLLIEARHEPGGRSRAHKDYDACDLAHCVVYRGLAGAPPAPETPWRIDPRSLACGAHFHAECGGRTLGARVFGPAGKTCHGERDRLSETGTKLCGGARSAWQARLPAKDLASILTGSDAPYLSPVSLSIDTKTLTVTLRAGDMHHGYPAEDFRLRINRRRGWSFLKSNEYRIETILERGETVFIFNGTGNGHGAGLCQKGALGLAQRGYSRHEILAHYYPAVRFMLYKHQVEAPPPGLSHALFDLQSGEITRSSHRGIENRVLPPGSIFKLVVALYCAAERPDLFDAHRYHCTGRAGTPLPERCWTPVGHGDVGMSEALSHSCNLYFASLNGSINVSSFRRFCESLSTAGIRIEMPPVHGPRESAHLLAGLDYRFGLSVRGLVALARLVSPGENASFEIQIAPGRRAIISRALFDTMDTGTAAGVLGTGRSDPDRSWGKTATILSGTNRLTGYGLFLGGYGENGILIILKDGTGAQAGRWAVSLLHGPASGAVEKK
ncbi:MAG TPA: hypothetical protein VLM75_02060 [Spirochaetota bacterium]|nr:hypothetical protein [Spirochaetota bacterium]